MPLSIQDIDRSFTSVDAATFEDARSVVSRFQYDNVDVFRRYCDSLSRPPQDCFLPIQAFKHKRLSTSATNDSIDAVFRSSGTGSTTRSSHFVRSIDVYQRSFRRAFEALFQPHKYRIAAHLPGYREAGSESSLLYMVEDLISGFGIAGSSSILAGPNWLPDHPSDGPKVMVFGAAFGLLDLLEKDTYGLPEGSVVIETGGMKTHRKEISRSQLHTTLSNGFGVGMDNVWSEYGMCELLSQAYRRPAGGFKFPSWVQWELFDPENPLNPVSEGPGLLGVYDIANMYSVSSILTEDLAVRKDDGFEVIGRLSGSDLRGCNFLIESAM